MGVVDTAFINVFLHSRVMLALVMGTGVAAHVYLKVTSPNPKWLIFMTNQVQIHLKQTRYKSISDKPGTNLKQRTCSFSGHGLAGPSLHSTRLVGPEGQALVDLDFLCLRLSFVSNKTKYMTPYLLDFFSHFFLDPLKILYGNLEMPKSSLTLVNNIGFCPNS